MSRPSLHERRLPRSPLGLDDCSCCLDLANRSGPGSPLGSPLGFNNNHLPLRPYAARENLNEEPRSRRTGLEPTGLRDSCASPRPGLRNRNIDQTLLAILLFFHSASGASVVAIDNKIEQAMDLVKNHLMYAVREEVEVLKEQIKELAEKNSQLERENSLLKNLASPEQLQKFQSRLPLEVPMSPAQEKESLVAPAPAQHSEGSAV